MQKIIIENFGPIKNAEIELRDFVVLIGEQASGKSTIGKLVFFFNLLSEDFLAIASQTDTNDLTKILNDLSKATTQKFSRYFGFPPYYQPSKFSSSFQKKTTNMLQYGLNEKEKKTTVRASYSKAFLDDYNKQFESLWKRFQSTPADLLKIEETDSEETKRDKSFRQFLMIKETGDSIYNIRPNSVFFPAARLITLLFSTGFRKAFNDSIVTKLESGNPVFNQSDAYLTRSFANHINDIIDFISQHKTFEKAIENYEQAHVEFDKNALQAFLKKYPSVLKGKYSLDGDGERIYFGDAINNSVLLENASSGQQESLRILQDIFSILINNLNVFRVIEEPEAHLFPTAQKAIIELLALVSNITPSQIIITTHSPYVLSVLANLLYADKIKHLQIVTSKEIEEKTDMIELTWVNKNKFAAYAMENGISKSIFDREETGLIDQNYLDQISEELGREFNFLYNLRVKQLQKK